MRVKSKKKNISKRNARSWRKNIDITDVDDFLEEQRLEERLGNLKSKTDDELFFVEASPVQKKDSKKRVTLKERRKMLLEKPLKCFASLENSSKVEDPNKKRNRVRTPEERKHFMTKLIAKNRKEIGYLTPKETVALKQKLKAYQATDEKKTNKKVKIFRNDLWEEKDKFIPELKNEWFNKNLVEYHMRNTGKPVFNTPHTIHDKTSHLPAVEAPHPGISYNPTMVDHSNLMQSVIEKEKIIIKQEEHLDRVVSKMIKKKPLKSLEYDRLLEMSAGLGFNESDNEDTKDGIIEENKRIVEPVKNKKKSKKTRGNIKKEKEFKIAIQKKKIEKKKLADIQRIKHIKKGIDKRAVEMVEVLKKQKEKKEQRKFEPKIISKLPYIEPDIDIILPEKMSGSLRTLRPHGKILRDRFKSLQKRNILPPNKKMGLVKPAKVKKYVRSSHKIIPEQPIKINKTKKNRK